ncbi:hypothetical protein TSAR_014592 [Trichomalopsis sarcophagae]|uniref:Uncharacterized protein n=1 Tax=Trichomalopsis sarcophagae TaxID=543379 RepID=A0A232F3S1_9HYME|nr:hypothetical protein TSAR_014592 [Trichomalopsis sarcophagae]
MDVAVVDCLFMMNPSRPDRRGKACFGRPVLALMRARSWPFVAALAGVGELRDPDLERCIFDEGEYCTDAGSGEKAVALRSEQAKVEKAAAGSSKSEQLELTPLFTGRSLEKEAQQRRRGDRELARDAAAAVVQQFKDVQGIPTPSSR